VDGIFAYHNDLSSVFFSSESPGEESRSAAATHGVQTATSKTKTEGSRQIVFGDGPTDMVGV
jgi:hypothetical protein